MKKIGRKPTDDQLLEGGGGGGGGISGTKWSKMPSFGGNASTVGDLKKLTKDTSNLKGAAKVAADEAKGRAATRTGVRAAGTAGAATAVKAALEDANAEAPKKARDTDEENFQEVKRVMREVDTEREAEKYAKSDEMKSGGSVRGWGKARGARKAKIY